MRKQAKNDINDAAVSFPSPYAAPEQLIGRGVRLEPGHVERIAEQRTALHRAYIVEQEKTKRTAMIVAGALLLAAIAVPLFAPAGRETLSYWLGGALLVFAAGAAGFRRVWAKSDYGQLLSESDSERVSN